MTRPSRQCGFTLVELIIVIVITGILAASLTIFLKPAIDAWQDSRRRAELTDMADHALRRMAQDIRRAVPNSVIEHSPNCLQLVPTLSGGGYRRQTDASGNGAVLDTSTSTSQFDVLTPMYPLAAAGDWVVVNNQNTGDVYNGSNRQAIASIATPAPGGTGEHRITLQSARQFPLGYDGGRFVIVANGEQSVFYTCHGNRLYRIVDSFASGKDTCASSGSVLASDISACTFAYESGVTQQSGMVWMQLSLTRDGESIHLAHGSHVDNIP